MNRYAAKSMLVCLSCLVIAGNSHACIPLDIGIDSEWSYIVPGNYGLSVYGFVVSGGPVAWTGSDYAWMWGHSGLAGYLDSQDEDHSTLAGVGAATPGVYEVQLVACNESGSYDTECAYVVVLPTGCSLAGEHDSSIHWDTDDDWEASNLDRWGTFDKESATYEIDFRYSDDAWVCEISNVRAFTSCKVRSPDYPGYFSVSGAGDVPCSDVNDAIYDLTDPDPDDDSGAPYDYYWCYQAVVHHETQHRSDWYSYYGQELAIAIAQAEAMSVPASEASTCQDAETMTSQSINGYFLMAKARALNRFNSVLTPLDEAEVRAYEAENAVLEAILADLPEGCTNE